MVDLPPVRYGIGQPGYDHTVGQRLIIRLDGVEQNLVRSYDCEAGAVTRYKPHEMSPRSMAGTVTLPAVAPCR